MQQIDENSHEIIKKVFEFTCYKKEDFSVCLGCKICASVCTANDLELNVNPQELLLSLFLNKSIDKEHPLIKYCTNCYQCTYACPWTIRIPEVIRAIRESIGIETVFEKAFKGSIKIWGRVYEPYVFLKTGIFLAKEGYLKYIKKWTGYIGFHLPKKVKIDR